MLIRAKKQKIIKMIFCIIVCVLVLTDSIVYANSLSGAMQTIQARRRTKQ